MLGHAISDTVGPPSSISTKYSKQAVILLRSSLLASAGAGAGTGGQVAPEEPKDYNQKDSYLQSA